MNYTNFTFSELITKISNARFWDLPKMLAEALRKIQQPKYKVYTALLSQSGTNAPVATVLENTLGGDIIWSYVGIGTYFGTLEDVFIEGKTYYNISTASETGNALDGLSGVIRVDSDKISVISVSSGADVSNGVLINTPIEIRVYN